MKFLESGSMTIMTVYKVRISRSAMRDMDDLEDFLKSVMSQSGANRYIDNMIAEVQSLSVYADLYRPSTQSLRMPSRKFLFFSFYSKSFIQISAFFDECQ